MSAATSELGWGDRPSACTARVMPARPTAKRRISGLISGHFLAHPTPPRASRTAPLPLQRRVGSSTHQLRDPTPILSLER